MSPLTEGHDFCFPFLNECENKWLDKTKIEQNDHVQLHDSTVLNVGMRTFG